MYQTIAVAGLGLIGGSMVKAVREYLPQTRVLGYELRQEVCDRALEESTIQAANDWEGLRQADLLLLALFPGQAMDFAAAHASRLRPGCVVIDLCGVKEAVCPTLEKLCLAHSLVYIGGHPMAGRERSGYDAALTNLYRGASMILVPTAASTPQAMEEASEFFTALGFGRIEVTTAEHHDRMIAFTSQLVHAVSNCYIKSPSAPDHHGYSAGSYRDLTRVARLDPAMWTELFLWNRQALLEEMDQLTLHLGQLRQAIDRGDREEVSRLLDEGNRRKIEIDGV